MLNREKLEQSIGSCETEYDVLVAGGGPAGFGAALAASLSGARTVLLESRSFLGGVAGTSLWMPINRLKINGGTRGGVHARLVEKLESFGGLACRPGKTTWTDGDGLHVHPDYLKLSMLELLEECGCSYRLNSPAVGALVRNGSVAGVRIHTKEGIETFRSWVVIDCTGDGDVCFAAGARFEKGRPGDGVMMPVTLGFALANVDTDKLFRFYDEQHCEESMRHWIEMAEADGYTVSPWYSFDRTTVPGLVSVNNGGMKGIGKLCATDPRQSTLAERAGIRLAVDFVSFARKYRIPGLENCYLDRTGAAVGVRETRRVVCDYMLTLEDAQQNTRFPDPVAKRYGAVDQAGLSSQESGQRVTMASGHAFPLRALMVSGLDNLMAAGRCGSYTHMALAAGKSMGNMMAIGQAAGAAAACACRQAKPIREVPYADVREALRALGVPVSDEEGVNW